MFCESRARPGQTLAASEDWKGEGNGLYLKLWLARGIGDFSLVDGLAAAKVKRTKTWDCLVARII